MFTKTDHVFHAGNMVDLNKDGKLNGRSIADSDFVSRTATLTSLQQNIPPVPVTTQSPATAFKNVELSAGAYLHRDAVDKRLIGYLKTLGKEGKIFKNEQDAGGQPPTKNGKVKKDSDADGIPDAWERSHHLNASDKSDANHISTAGYTFLEQYLHSLVN
jgi:hypothetical protein